MEQVFILFYSFYSKSAWMVKLGQDNGISNLVFCTQSTWMAKNQGETMDQVI